MPKRIQQWIPLVILIVVVVIVCPLSGATPDRVDTPRPIECPHPPEIEPCPYRLAR